MSEEGKNRNSFSMEDIRNYLEGKLSPEEMHAIEKAAMEDPFLADAIEGMEMHQHQAGKKAFEDDLSELHKKLHNRIHEKRRRGIFISMKAWQAIAAIFILFIGLSLTYFFVLNKNQGPQKIASAKQPRNRRDSDNKKMPAPNDIPVTSEQSDSNHLQVENQIENSQRKKQPNEDALTAPGKEMATKETAMNQKKKEEAPLQRQDSVIHHDNDLAINAMPSQVPPPVTEKSLEGKAAGLTIQKDKTDDRYYFEGKVTDLKNEPIAGATVKMKNRKNATVTNKQGFFKLPIGDMESGVSVEIASVGYQPRSAILDSGSSGNIIQLQPNSASLSNVVVSGYTSRSKKDPSDEEDAAPDETVRAEKVLSGNALPVNGWKEFNLYIDRNKKISTADSIIKGNEIISFQVSKNGELSSFSIIKSLSPAHDSTSIRLIKEGPAWKISKGKKQKASVVISF